MQKTESVIIWAEQIMQFYSAYPVICKYKRRNKNVILYTLKRNESIAKLYFSKAGLDEVKIIEDLQYYKIKRILHQILEAVIVRRDFSIIYQRRLKSKALWMRIISTIFSPIKPKNSKVNKFYDKAFSLLYWTRLLPQISFNADEIISFTKVNHAYALAGCKIPHISIMESWDHPMKDPLFINPYAVLTWNKDLADDFKAFQNIRKVRIIRPLKFRYLFEQQGRSESKKTPFTCELEFIEHKIDQYIIYPCCFSSRSFFFEEEKRFIRDLLRIFKDFNLTLYLKPHPDGLPDDLVEFSDIEKVKVGLSFDGPKAIEMLDDEYQHYRKKLLENCKGIINVGTTFALEAVLMNKAVLQLELNNEDYAGFSRVSKTVHLTKYILPLPGVVKFNRTNQSLIKKLIETPDMTFSSNLKRWLVGGR